MHNELFIAPDRLELPLQQPDEIGRLDDQRDVASDGRQPGAQLVALAEEADGAAVDLGDVPVAEGEAVDRGGAGRQTVAGRQSVRQHLEEGGRVGGGRSNTTDTGPAGWSGSRQQSDRQILPSSNNRGPKAEWYSVVQWSGLHYKTCSM